MSKKQRQTRGILGVMKASRPMLFTFQPKDVGGEWPSEDSDSDFKPSDEESHDEQEERPASPLREDKTDEANKDNLDDVSTSQSQSSDMGTDEACGLHKRHSKHKKKKDKKKHKKKKKKFEERDIIEENDKKADKGTHGNNDEKKAKKTARKRLKRIPPFGSDGKRKKRKLVKVGGDISSETESEYTPSDEEGERKLLEKNDVKKSKKGTLLQSKTDKSSEEMKGADDEMWGIRLPMIALERIFSYVIEKTGAVPVLCSLSRVCRLWREAAWQPMLWQHIDLANGRVKMMDRTVHQLADSGRLAQLRDVSFSGWKKLTDNGLLQLSDHCPHLEWIDLTMCIGLSADGVKTLVEKCTKLKALDLSKMTDKITVAMPDLLELLGDRLQHLTLAHNMLKVKGRTTIIKVIAAHCKQLKTLDLSNCQFSTDFLVLPIEELQGGCPRLQTLRLTGCRIRATQVTSRAKAESPGFPCLSDLSLAVSTESTMNMGVGIDDQFLMRILKNANHLKLLDLRGLTAISAKGIQDLTADHLEQLYISQCSLSKYEGVEIVVQKWRHSLVNLDLSWNVFPGMSLDVAMTKLSSSGQSVLRDLNLSGTAITDDRVRSILQGCPNLVNLNLTSCRGLPRGMKRPHGPNDLLLLAKQLGVVTH